MKPNAVTVLILQYRDEKKNLDLRIKDVIIGSKRRIIVLVFFFTVHVFAPDEDGDLSKARGNNNILNTQLKAFLSFTLIWQRTRELSNNLKCYFFTLEFS